jgi:GNAT superfamily N-acetyltransferase
VTGPDTGIQRVDDRLGLAVERASLSARSLVTYARDHVTVRTPSRPDFRAGNTLDLLVAPLPEDLARWIARFAETTGRLGVGHVQLRWETPLGVDAPALPALPDPALAAELDDLGFALGAVTVLLLDQLADPPAAPAELVPVEPPSAAPGGPVDRHWHAATVLYRYESGEGPDDWRGSDGSFVAWSVDVQRELAADGRAQVWLAMRHGAPVCRLTVAHDRQGLAVVEDVIVHPVHRRLGIASALTHAAVARHLAERPGSRVGIGAEPGGPADHLSRRLGFRPHATVWTALRA